MQIKWPWFERTFEFGFPPEKIPDILERLRGTPGRIELILSRLDDKALQYRESDTWSIQENVGHLGDLEPLWIGRIADVIDRLETMREADLRSRFVKTRPGPGYHLESVDREIPESESEFPTQQEMRTVIFVRPHRNGHSPKSLT